MKLVLKTILSAAAMATIISVPAFAQQTFHSVAERPPATAGSVPVDSSASAGNSAAIEAFKSLPEEERSALLQQAISSFKSMSPEEQQALTEQAKLMGGDAGSFGAEWDKLLTPEQKKIVNDQLGGLVKDSAPAPTAKAADTTPMTDRVTAIMIQIKDLPPAQQQALLNSLKASGAAPPAAPATATATAAPPVAAPVNTDPCAEYKTANPAMYANCTSRMNPQAPK